MNTEQTYNEWREYTVVVTVTYTCIVKVNSDNTDDAIESAKERVRQEATIGYFVAEAPNYPTIGYTVVE